jgi:predicted ester cyclase
VGVEENRAVIRRWVEVSNAHDVDALVELFTPDTFDHVGRSAGPEWWRQVFGFLYATLPDWRWTLEDLVAEDDRVVARPTARGTHLGSEIPFLRGIAPTGKAVAWSHHHSFRLVNGKIAEQWANRDDRGFLRQVTPSDAWRSRERARVRCRYRLAGWAA